MAAGFLSAVGGPGVQPGIAGSADLLVSVVLLGQQTQGRLNHPSPRLTDNLVFTSLGRGSIISLMILEVT